ncbi:unnamed protein product [Caenorhabditis auriculariae]|uniref:Uncharacterized protein n=1 Tax=Caenorhabditis auriculariae TaxID=2777116 RepID=A0A8S1HVK2_9PELO|nr:unnamed protein product [Caenorhabditis auriculariae]
MVVTSSTVLNLIIIVKIVYVGCLSQEYTGLNSSLCWHGDPYRRESYKDTKQSICSFDMEGLEEEGFRPACRFRYSHGTLFNDACDICTIDPSSGDLCHFDAEANDFECCCRTPNCNKYMIFDLLPGFLKPSIGNISNAESDLSFTLLPHDFWTVPFALEQFHHADWYINSNNTCFGGVFDSSQSHYWTYFEYEKCWNMDPTESYCSAYSSEGGDENFLHIRLGCDEDCAKVMKNKKKSYHCWDQVGEKRKRKCCCSGFNCNSELYLKEGFYGAMVRHRAHKENYLTNHLNERDRTRHDFQHYVISKRVFDGLCLTFCILILTAVLMMYTTVRPVRIEKREQSSVNEPSFEILARSAEG